VIFRRPHTKHSSHPVYPCCIDKVGDSLYRLPQNQHTIFIECRGQQVDGTSKHM